MRFGAFSPFSFSSVPREQSDVVGGTAIKIENIYIESERKKNNVDELDSMRVFFYLFWISMFMFCDEIELERFSEK